METRRISRERALQILFYSDISCYDKETIFSLFCNYFMPSKQSKRFFKKIVEGVWKHKNNIDLLIEEHSNNWKIHRISCVDRNILRFATFELLYCKDIPSRVSINEAIDIAKRFGSSESGSFVNGVLNSIHVSIIINK